MFVTCSFAAFVACGADVTVPSGGATNSRAIASAAPAAPAPEFANVRRDAPAAASTDMAAAEIAQKLIRGGELTVKVKDVTVAMKRADSIMTAIGGMVADSRVSVDDQRGKEATIVARVPSAQFSRAVDAFGTLGEMRRQALNTQDITKQYADLETRLAVKEQTVTRLRALLDGRSAKLSDVLEVEREIDRAVSELESMKGERRYYDQQVAMSSLTVTLVENTSPQAGSFTEPITDALRASGRVLATSLAAIISIVAFLVPWLLIAALILWIARKIGIRPPRFRQRAATAAKPSATDSA